MIPVVTEISPIFGLTLLELTEFLNIVAGVGSIIIAGAIICVHWHQHRLQIKSNSADLITRIREDWSMSRNPEFGKFLQKLAKGIVTANDPMIPPFIRVLEKVAIFWEEGTLTKNHVKEFFGANLKHIVDNKPVHDYLKDRWAEKPHPHFTNLKKLLDKSKTWN